MNAPIVSNPIPSTEPARHTVERVLSTIAATARLDGMVAPRRISFDEPRVGEPLAVLSLTWPSLDAMFPWLEFFTAGETHTYRQDDGSMHYVAYGDYHGWSVSLNALDPPTVSPEGIPEHLADHFAVLNPDVPDPYVPVAWPTGDAANADECARLNAESDARQVLDGMGNRTTPGAAGSTAAIGAAIERTARSIHRVPTEAHLRNGHEPHADHEPTDRDARIVEVVTVELDLRDGGRGDPGMASLMRQPYAADQGSFAEAPERLRTARDNESFAQIVAGEVAR